MENKLKNQIKELSAEQTFNKDQRKAVHISGERKISATEAAAKHVANRYKLRLMHVAYAILRGKDPVVAVSNYDSSNPFHVKAVEKYVKEHEEYFAERKAYWEVKQAAWDLAKQSL